MSDGAYRDVLASSSPPSARPHVRRLQILALGVVGALAILAFVLSLLLDGGAGSASGGAALGLGLLCAVIGLSLAFTGNRR